MIWVQWGSFAMLTGVVLGAFGAHALKSLLSGEARAIYQTAVWYHLIHGLALFVVAWLASLKPENHVVKYAGCTFVTGIFLFSGSLYVLSLTGIKKWGMVTPFGGVAFLIGWVLLFLAAQ